MLASQRHETIVREVRMRGSVRVVDLAPRLDASVVTIRRDIAELARQGVLRRVHGGATLPVAEVDGTPERRTPATGRPDQGAAAAVRSAARTQVAARRVPGQPNALIGLVVPSATYYYTEVVRGAEEAAHEAGARLVLGVSGYERTEERDQVQRLLGLGVDGILIAPATTEEEDPETFDMLRGLTTPVVLVERSADPMAQGAVLDHVRSDHTYGAVRAIHHLADLGHRRVMAVVNGASVTSPWILAGHREAGVRFGRRHAARVAELPPLSAPPATVREALNAVLDRCLAERITGVLIHPDAYAVTFAEVAADRGVSIPGDLSVIAYDDEIAALADPPLTAVAPSKVDVGRTAVQMCMERITAAPTGRQRSAHRMTLLPALVVRGSTGLPPGGGRKDRLRP